jgi:hypothetical protein
MGGSGQRLGKNVPATTDTKATIEALRFICGLCRDVISKGQVRSKSPILSSERMLHKYYDHRGLVEKIAGRESQVVWRQDDLIGGNRQF